MLLLKGDCLEHMQWIPDGSVDMVMTDPPYGTTACKWDSIIPLEPMWGHLKRIIKPNGAIVMTASQPFTTTLIASNMKMFKYCWVWEKTKASNFQLAKVNPMKVHEDIPVFYAKKPTYNQHTLEYGEFKNSRDSISGMTNLAHRTKSYVSKAKGYNKSIIKIGSEHNPPHPTQKPVALMEYLIKTYTNEGELVLDFACGSGTTGVACANTGRHYIMIERDTKYVEIARNRVQKAKEEMGLFGG